MTTQRGEAGRGRRIRWAWLTMLALVGGALAWVLWPQALQVEVATVDAGPMQVTVDDQGETRSHDRFVVSAPVAGQVARIELHDGDPVMAGQVLARIAPVPLSRREVEEIEARVAAARAAERESLEGLRRAEQELAQTAREAARTRKLADDGFVGPQAAEQAATRESAANSALEAARARTRAAAADVRAAGAALSAAQRGPAGLIEVRAPAAGRILRIHDPSDRVVAAGAPLMTLGHQAGLEIVIELLSSEAVKVTAGMPVLIEGWGGDQTLRATVRRVEPYAVTRVSALGIEEKRVNVIADFVDAPDRIGDGYRITARIVIWSAERVLRAPASALFRCAEHWCVFVVDAGRAHRRSVEIGRRNPVEAEVLAGLSVGEQVIRHPGNALAEGVRVRVEAAR